jgi:hypothetical protein
MATLTYKNDLRNRQDSAGAGMVDARTGGAGVAAAARWAMQQNPTGSEIGGKLDSLIGVVSQSHTDAGMVKLHK